MAYLSNFWLWAMASAWLLCIGTARGYIEHADKLCRLIDSLNPGLWDKLWGRGNPSLNIWAIERRPRGLDRLVLFNAAADCHPEDPQFRYALSRARQFAFLFLLFFVAGCVFLAKADLQLPAHLNMRNQ